MKITKRQLRRIIREALEPMTLDYVLNSLSHRMTFGPHKGMSHGELVMSELANGNPLKAAYSVMDALMIDDPPEGADDELAQSIKTASSLEDVAEIAANWGTHHFRSGAVDRYFSGEPVNESQKKRRVLLESMDPRAWDVDPRAWAASKNGRIERDEMAQIIIYLDKEDYPTPESFLRDLPDAWDYEEMPDLGGYSAGWWVIYTGQYPAYGSHKPQNESKIRFKRIIRETLSILKEAYAQPPDIERYLETHGLEAGIDYDFGGDGVKRDYYLIALRLSAEELASMLDNEMYPESPIRGRDLGTSSGPDGDYVTW